MTWQIEFSKKAAKQAKKLNKQVLSSLLLLVDDLRRFGPCPGKQWQNYSKLKGKLKGKLKINNYHCHICKGKPTYVCCWEVINKKVKIIEIYYVGSHEKAPY